jgi:uncharacterized protein (DUF2235 family)
MAKNIVILSDGTSKEGGEGHDTNIYKLFNLLEDRTPHQVVFYDPGVGTQWRNKLSGCVGGNGLSENICQCYRFIFERFEAGDQLFLLGFSRGAATVRSLSGFLHYFGVLPACRPELIGRAYEIYQIEEESTRRRQAEEFIARHHTMWTRVKFLGCFDTVAALGVPVPQLDPLVDRLPGFRHRFHNFRLSDSVEHARHALAIDDERKVFHPVLWDPEIQPYQTLRQLWFCGMHADIGGGYAEQELSDLPLEWMLRQATDLGLRIYPKHKVLIQGRASAPLHDSRGTPLTRLFQRAVRSWDVARRGRPVIHRSVQMRATDPACNYRPWILALDPQVED